jgi:hypothetical protein
MPTQHRPEKNYHRGTVKIFSHIFLEQGKESIGNSVAVEPVGMWKTTSDVFHIPTSSFIGAISRSML